MDNSNARRLIASARALEGEAESLARLFRYWDTSRGKRRMPRRRDIDPVDMKEFLPDLLLVDVEGTDEAGRGIFRYRLVGTREVALRGADPTGKLVKDAYFGPSAEDALTCYETVCRERAVLYDPLPFTTEDHRWRHQDTLFLPLSEDGDTVSQVLVCALKRNIDLSS